MLDARVQRDIEKFGDQLCEKDPAAIEMNWKTEDRIPIFAVTYVQRNPSIGRFKFDQDQWSALLYITQKLARAGVAQFRLWLDQCLWLRDASQQAWAHTGLLPYTMWPVICLGKKQADSDKSVESRERMWPFVEEVAGLWGMGVLFAREMRSKDENSGFRWWPSCQLRARSEPEDVMMILLLNIFHGAMDHLQTGWQDDVIELGEMAAANIFSSSDQLFVGSDWRQRVTRSDQKSWVELVRTSCLSCKWGSGEYSVSSDDESDGVNIFLDGSRAVIADRWDGMKEWLSGNEDGVADEYNLRRMYNDVQKLNIRTDAGEFQILTYACGYRADCILVRLLVAMDGPTSNFSRGKVAWTKVMTGVGSCEVTSVLRSNNFQALAHILSKELRRKIVVQSMVSTNAEIQWI